MQHRSQPDFQLACPVRSAFNAPEVRFCPYCGHMLGAPHIVENPSAQRPSRGRFSHAFVVILILVVGVEAGLLTWLWPRTRTFLSQPNSPALPTRIEHPAQAGTGAERRQGTPSERSPVSGYPGATITPAAQADKAARRTSEQPASASVTLALLDREGDLLRQAPGTLSDNGRHVVTTFESIYGAYSGTVRLPDKTTLLISAVDWADPTGNVAVLALDSMASASMASPLTLEPLARTTYEETPREQRYLAEKRARAGRWDEAIAHWKRAIEQDPSLRRAIEPALGDAFLKASTTALTQGRSVEVHTQLLDAITWLPERGDIRLLLAESFLLRREYREAVTHYGAALDLLPTQAVDITAAIVRVYREWGHELLRQADFPAAANIFREALQLDSSNGELYFAWGKAEFRRGALTIAVEAFEAAQAYDRGLQSEVEPYLVQARALLGGPQTVTIDFPPGSLRIQVPVVINGRVEIPFIIDTGAAVTLIPAWAAEMLGYRAQAPAEWIRVQTAAGPRRFPYGTVSRLEIQGLGVSNLRVIFGDLPGHDESRGLLGMDFLRYFSLAVDHEIGRMTLRPK